MIKNVIASLLSYGTNVVIAFFLSPYILRRLGDAQYGVWALFGEMLTYYGLLDFGVRSALSYYAGQALASHRNEDLRRHLSTAFYSLTIIAVVAFVSTTGLLIAFRNHLGDAAISPDEVVASASFFLFIFCLGLPFETFSAVLVGNVRLYLVNVSEIAARVLSTALMFVVLSWKPSLIALAVTQLAAKTVYWALLAYFSRKYVPDARISIRLATWSSLRQLVSYGGQNFFLQTSVLLLTRKDIILITAFWGVAFVPLYAFARILVQNITFACQAVTQPLRPNLLLYWTRGEKDKAYEVYYTGARYSSFVAGMLVAFVAAYSSDILRLWVGRRFVEGDILFRSDIVLLLLLFANLPRLLHSISWQFLFATNTQRGLTILLMCEAVVNIVLSLLLVKPYGLVGLGIASLIPMVLSHLINVPLLIRKSVGASFRRYVTDGVARPLAGSVVIFLLGVWLRFSFPVVGWTELFLQGGILASLALLFGVAVVATPLDRERLVNKLRRVPAAVRAVTP